MRLDFLQPGFANDQCGWESRSGRKRFHSPASLSSLCQCPHWGYVLQGKLTVTYADGNSEQISGGNLFHWPPGHTVKVSQDAEVVLFSPQHEHSTVIDHMLRRMAG